MKTQKVFDVITTTIENYQEKATQAVKVGDGKLYVPGYMSLEDFLRLIEDPSLLMQTGDNAKEPAYLSVEEGLCGRNADGSEHNGFIIMDIIAREIIAIVDRNGKSSFDPTKEILKGLWGGYKIRTTNSKGEKFEIETRDGVRGINIPVTVIVDNGKWSVVLDRDHRSVAIAGVTKVTQVG
jgi:hypothetical protein